MPTDLKGSRNVPAATSISSCQPFVLLYTLPAERILRAFAYVINLCDVIRDHAINYKLAE